MVKIVSWVEKYSGLKYFKEFDYSKDEIWDSKYDAVRNYLVELKRLLDHNITKFGQIRVLNSNKDNANLKIVKEYKCTLVYKDCGEIFNTSDKINRFYLINFELDKNYFQKTIKMHYFRFPKFDKF